MKNSLLSCQLIDEVKTSIPRVSYLQNLLDKGADINYQQPETGYTALMHAAEENKNEIIDYLLWKGADPLIKNNFNCIASDLTLEQTLSYLSIKDFELLFSAMNNDLEAANHAIETGALINFQGPGGYCALLIAVEENHPEMVDFLLFRGADLTLKSNEGRNAFQLSNNTTILELLENIRSIRNEILEMSVKTTSSVFSWPFK